MDPYDIELTCAILADLLLMTPEQQAKLERVYRYLDYPPVTDALDRALALLADLELKGETDGELPT